MQSLDKLISELKKAKESLRADKKEPRNRIRREQDNAKKIKSDGNAPKYDPGHEQKEQEKAKKIKKEAQNLLDLHKEETNGMAAPAPAPAASPGAPNMSKADSITPEQQKANKAKAQQEVNDSAKIAARIDTKPAEVKPEKALQSHASKPMQVTTGSGKPGGQSPNPKLIAKSQEVFDELVKNGHTESALLLRNWGEEDSLAKSCRAELEKSKISDRMTRENMIRREQDKIEGNSKRRKKLAPTQAENEAGAKARDLDATETRYHELENGHPVKAKLHATLKRMGRDMGPLPEADEAVKPFKVDSAG